MKYQIQYRTRRYKDRPLHPWQNAWIDYDSDTQKIGWNFNEITVKSDDLDVIRMSLNYLHNHSQGMCDHRIISVIDEVTAVFDPA